MAMICVLLLIVGSVRLAWTNVEVNIAADRRSSDGQKLLVVKEQSDLHIVCETTADNGVEWRVNVHTPLTAGVDGVEMSEDSRTVDGKLKTVYTLNIRNTSVADTGTYSCHFGAVSDQVNVIIARLAKLKILEAKTPELRLMGVTELTLHCEGKQKSRPTWRHNDTVVEETSDTELNQLDDRTSGRRTVVMTRHGVTQRFSGRYQCVDTAFFQSDSDIVTVLAGTVTSPSTSVVHCTAVQLLFAAVLLVTILTTCNAG